MPKPISFEKIEVNAVSSMEETHGVVAPDTPFRIAVLGDFCGRAGRGLVEPVSRKPHLVDRDNFDRVLAKLGVALKLPILGKDSPAVSIRFSGLDDFHPDNLFENLELFQALRDTRKSIQDPSNFAALTRKFQNTGQAPEPSPSAEDMEKSLLNIAGETTGDLLDQILETPQDKGSKTASSRGTSEFDNFLKQIVTPHLVPDIEPELAELAEAVDAATGELMRMILHHPDFQALEAAWRAVHFLVSRLETDEKLKLYLFDISKAELTADLKASEDLSATGIYKLLVGQTVLGNQPWAVIAGNYTFGQSREDVELLGCMGIIAGAAGAPFISAVHDQVLGCESLARTPDPDDWFQTADPKGKTAWEILRKLPEASYLGLALPRFLLRLPYGEETDPTDTFDFEEMDAGPKHDFYLWGNPSFACVYLLAQAFSQYGWEFRPGAVLNIDRLPLHLYKEEDESRIKACAEVVLTERALEFILDKGIMPLLSYKNQDTARLARFQSLSDPPTNLSGRWG